METIKLATILLMLVLLPAVYPKSLFRQVRQAVKESTPAPSNESSSQAPVQQASTTISAVPVTSVALQDHRSNETEPVQVDGVATTSLLLHHHPDHLTNDSAPEANASKQSVEKATTELVPVSKAKEDEKESGKSETTPKANSETTPKESSKAGTSTLKTLEQAEGGQKSEAVELSTTPAPAGDKKGESKSETSSTAATASN